jgi:glycosyltransferase involved in cell wall biosynthesis
VSTDRQIRVLHVVTDSFSAFEFVAPIVIYARDEGVSSTIVCSGREYADAHSFIDQIRELGIDVRDVKIARDAIAPLADFRAVVQVTRMLRSGQFDLVHTRLGKAGVVGRIAARLAGVPAVHTVDDFAFVGTSGVRRAVYLGLEKAMSRLTENIMFVSESEHRVAIEHRIGRPDRRTVVGHGVDLELYDPSTVDVVRLEQARARHGVSADRPVVGGIGRLVPRKGWNTFLAGAAMVLEEFPDAQFLVVGGGAMEQELRRSVVDLGIANSVVFTGFIDDQTDMPYFYAMMDVFCLPSTREGFGMVFAEAGAMGKPVVACDIQPVNGIIVDGESGIVVPVHDPVPLAMAIRRLLASPEAAARMGAKGRERVVAEFDLSARHGNVTEIYRSVLARSAASAAPVRG